MTVKTEAGGSRKFTDVSEKSLSTVLMCYSFKYGNRNVKRNMPNGGAVIDLDRHTVHMTQNKDTIVARRVTRNTPRDWCLRWRTVVS